MKQLSEFTGKAATDLLGLTLKSLSGIMRNKKNCEYYAKNDIIGMFGSALTETPEYVVSLLAALNEKKPEEYEYTAESLMADTFALFNDKAVMRLFGSQS